MKTAKSQFLISVSVQQQHRLLLIFKDRLKMNNFIKSKVLKMKSANSACLLSYLLLIVSFNLFCAVKTEDLSTAEYTVENITNEISANKKVFVKLWQTQQAEMEDGFKLYQEIQKQQQILSELQHTTAKYLRERAISKMSSILSGNQSSFQSEQFYEAYGNLSKYFESKILEEIVCAAVEAVYAEESTDILLEQLASIWQDSDNLDIKYFEIMFLAQLKLHNLHNVRSKYNASDYLAQFVLFIKKIKQHILYSNFKPNLKQAINKAIVELPDNIKYIFLRTSFCLKNAQHGENIYRAVNLNLNSFSRYIWLWWDGRSIDSTGNIKAEIIQNDEEALKITLRGPLYDSNYYLMHNAHNTIAGLSSSKEPFNHIWQVELYGDDTIFLTQVDFILCSDRRYDSSSRSVYGYKYGEDYNTQYKSCHWVIGSCSSI